jgi:hypothetical protein
LRMLRMVFSLSLVLSLPAQSFRDQLSNPMVSPVAVSIRAR